MDGLEKIGLSKNEIKAFRVLLKQQRISAQDISKKSGIPPTKVYSVLRKMVRKGIVEEVAVGVDERASYYSLINPSLLAGKWIKEKQREIQDISQSLQEAMRIYEENVPVNIDSWTLDYAQRISKFREVSKKTEKKALLMEQDGSHFHLFWDLIRRKIDIRMALPRSSEGSVKKAFIKNMEIFFIPNEIFDDLPTFSILDGKHVFVFTDRDSFGFYSRNPKIVRLFEKIFNLYVKKPELLK